MMLGLGLQLGRQRGGGDTAPPAEDTTPTAFSFTDVTDVSVSTQYTSNSITVSGINVASVPISITGGEYSINGGAYTSSSGTVSNASSVTVRVTSSASNSTAVNVVLTIGGVSDTYTVTTEAGGAGYTFTNAEAETAVLAMSVEPDDARKELYDDLVGALKTAGVWAELDVLYILKAHDFQAAKLNIKNPGTYNLTETVAGTFTADAGWAGNGTTSYMNTGYAAGVGQMLQDDNHMMVWVTDASAANTVEFGATNYAIASRLLADQTQYRNSSSTTNTVASVTDGSGFHLTRRTIAASFIADKNATALGSQVRTSGAVTAATLYIGGRNAAGALSAPSAKQVAFASAGGAVTAGQSVSFYNALEAYRSAVDTFLAPSANLETFAAQGLNSLSGDQLHTVY